MKQILSRANPIHHFLFFFFLLCLKIEFLIRRKGGGLRQNTVKLYSLQLVAFKLDAAVFIFCSGLCQCRDRKFSISLQKHNSVPQTHTSNAVIWTGQSLQFVCTDQFLKQHSHWSILRSKLLHFMMAKTIFNLLWNDLSYCVKPVWMPPWLWPNFDTRCVLTNVWPFKSVGPLSTKFPVDRMAFGQSWPKT